MGCKINTLNPPIFYEFPQKGHKIRTRTIAFPSFTTSSNQENLKSSISTQVQAPKTDVYTVNFNTLGDCKLGISRYPIFVYNAEGGNGKGRDAKVTEDEISIEFDIDTPYIPALESKTTKFLGLPLPPFLNIDIVPELFQGKVNKESGKVDLEFRATFWFSVGSIHRAPPLLVETVLTSEESKGSIRRGKGERMNSQCKCVGIFPQIPSNRFAEDS